MARAKNSGRRRYWLFKSEPDVYGIERFEAEGRTHWDGIRNYQVRNMSRDDIDTVGICAQAFMWFMSRMLRLSSGRRQKICAGVHIRSLTFWALTPWRSKPSKMP